MSDKEKGLLEAALLPYVAATPVAVPSVAVGTELLKVVGTETSLFQPRSRLRSTSIYVPQRPVSNIINTNIVSISISISNTNIITYTVSTTITNLSITNTIIKTPSST